MPPQLNLNHIAHLIILSRPVMARLEEDDFRPKGKGVGRFFCSTCSDFFGVAAKVGGGKSYCVCGTQLSIIEF